MIGVDTSFLIDFFRGEREAVEFMDENKDMLHLCENVVYEFMCGNLTEEEKDRFLGFVSQFPIMEFDRDSALEASEIFRSGKRKGETVPHPDAMVAGIYRSNNIERIVTRNPDDFKGIEDLEVTDHTTEIPADKPDIQEAKQTLEEGGLVIFPTETAYGIAANALDREAVEKVYEVKQRPREKGLTVICSGLEQVERYAELTGEERKLVEEFMPGPLTLVVEKNDRVPDVLNEKFVFRISSSEIARKLAENGPITATSANISGAETSYSVEGIDPGLREKVDFVVDAGELDPVETSTIAEVNNSRVVIHREGPVKRDQIEEVFG